MDLGTLSTCDNTKKYCIETSLMNQVVNENLIRIRIRFLNESVSKVFLNVTKTVSNIDGILHLH